MFNRTYVFNPDNSDAIRQVARSNDRMSDAIRETSENEIKARDRVDITLEEYERLKKTIRILEHDSARCKWMLKQIGIPLDVVLNRDNSVDNVQTHYMDDAINMIRKYRIEFEVPERILKGWVG